MVVVRPQVDDDIEQIAALHVRTWQAAYADLMPADLLAALDPAQFAARRREYAGHPDVRTLVAEDEGVVCGFAAFGPYQRAQRPDDLDRSIGELYALYVEPRSWGGGLGRALLAAAARALAARGLADLRLWVLEDNAPARRFYERSGLAADGERSTIRLTRPGGAVVDLPEVRYTGRIGAGGLRTDRDQGE
jgi:ribosomal protein S18 acetylase RimI-like enzyme